MTAFLDRIKSLPATIGSSLSHWRGEDSESSRWFKILAALVVIYILVGLVLAMIWSSEPDTFSVREAALVQVENNESRLVTGAYTTSALITVVEIMLEKPGGYLTNDITFPGIWMDNIPSWEFGVLIQVRDLAKAMRQSFSRSQSQSREDPRLALAEPQFNFSNDSWIMPATESEYREGVKHLREYLQALTDEDSSNTQFYARADNLRYWITTVESRLGDLSQQLSASVGPKRLNTDLAGDAEAAQATQAPDELEVKTPWLEIDNVFYQARGTTWALIHFLKAVEIDFAGVLEKKNAAVSLRQIIRELEATQQSVMSPVILNGRGLGVFANHSLVMASYISRANAALIDLRELLSQG